MPSFDQGFGDAVGVGGIFGGLLDEALLVEQFSVFPGHLSQHQLGHVGGGGDKDEPHHPVDAAPAEGADEEKGEPAAHRGADQELRAERGVEHGERFLEPAADVPRLKSPPDWPWPE